MLRHTNITPDLFSVHEYESNGESQTILDNNRYIFSADCKKVYDLLMSGKRMTVKEMDVDRSRLSDLKRQGFKFSFELKEGRYKVWFCSSEDKEFNKVQYEKLKRG